jgi:hypothetical protein
MKNGFWVGGIASLYLLKNGHNSLNSKSKMRLAMTIDIRADEKNKS